MTRKISLKVPQKVIKADLEKYRKMAIELGATDAKIIQANAVIIDERVRAKCRFPKCEWYGTNAHCPPYAMDVSETRALVGRYKYGIFMDLCVASNLLTGPEVAKVGTNVPSGIKMHEIVARIEAEAFYDSYHLALGFALGACKLFYCRNLECSALITGQSCRHPLKARSSMEGSGMDVYSMAAKVGWDIYPIGGKTTAEDVPHGHRLGLVLIY
jgi:predicted metal-binding protein